LPDAAERAVKVEHDEEGSRFVVRMDGEEAELAYTRVGPRLIDLQHTYVPASARGHGVAEELATAAFAYARQHGYRVVPTCPFVRRWLAHHPDEAKLVDPPYAKFLEDRPRP
jgi:predicted GNAT family acetyltransferase